MRALYILILSATMLLQCGCSASSSHAQLERVAKDWSEAIRASQVIPAYPLTEDLQPGDIFLVTTRVEDEVAEYRKGGYLPLGMHLFRLEGLPYQSYYFNHFGTTDTEPPPYNWIKPEDVSAVAENAKADTDSTRGNNAARMREKTKWHNAPRAFFPSYSFAVGVNSGASLSAPIKGVPVGLSLLGAENATGAVAISDAYTYGVPLEQLCAKVRNWTSRPDVRARLRAWKQYVASAQSTTAIRWRQRREPKAYLRVVSRVFLAGSMNVSLTAKETRGGAAEAGKNAQSRTIPAAPSKEKTALERAQEMAAALASVNTSLDNAIPSGRVSVTAATDRTISLTETFDRPLVFGYLALDFEILKDGSLSLLPIPSDQRVAGPAEEYTMSEPPPEIAQDTVRQLRLMSIYQVVKNKEPKIVEPAGAISLYTRGIIDFEIEEPDIIITMDQPVSCGQPAGRYCVFSDGRFEWVQAADLWSGSEDNLRSLAHSVESIKQILSARSSDPTRTPEDQKQLDKILQFYGQNE